MRRAIPQFAKCAIKPCFPSGYRRGAIVCLVTGIIVVAENIYPPAAISQKSGSAVASAVAPVQADSLPLVPAKLAPPLQPLIDTGKGVKNTAPAPPTTPPQIQMEDGYPVISQLELLVFGAPARQLSAEDRLANLENAVYRRTFSDQTLFDRTERLKTTLIGGQAPPDQQAGLLPLQVPATENQLSQTTNQGIPNYYEQIAAQLENQPDIPEAQLKQFALDLINGERYRCGYPPLAFDEIGDKIANAQAADMAKRRTVSHFDAEGNNPDRRYTLAEGSDALFESLVLLKGNEGALLKHNKATIAHLLKIIASRQDEHDALLSPDATGIGFALRFGEPANHDVFAAVEVISKHASMDPIPAQVQLGEKVAVKGVISAPYKFEKITLAWEAKNQVGASSADESEDALPYFAPLDYAAYSERGEHDYSSYANTLRTVGVMAAIAGGIFMPPVAFAAPIIAMSGSNGEPKPVSDIPVKGGVRIDGPSFTSKVSINHQGKEGLYYVTVWASLNKYGKPIAISRRAILATSAHADSPETPSETVSKKKPRKAASTQ